MTTLDVSVDPAVAARRAIEALRSGVPSRDAVAALGSGQAAIEDRFQSLCTGVAGGTSSGQSSSAGGSLMLNELPDLRAVSRASRLSRIER